MTDITDGWIQLYGGCWYDFTVPTLKHVTLEAIAHSPSMQCRFNGNTRRFYSVAEHSLRVAEFTWERWPQMRVLGDSDRVAVTRAALLHDAAEAIITDLPRPLRKMDSCAGVNDEISRVESLIQDRWPGEYDHPAILQADLAMLHTEKQQLLHPAPRPWPDMPPPLDIRLECWSPAEAKSRFLHECRQLGIE
jgi:hypothetical protein